MRYRRDYYVCFAIPGVNEELTCELCDFNVRDCSVIDNLLNCSKSRIMVSEVKRISLFKLSYIISHGFCAKKF